MKTAWEINKKWLVCVPFFSDAEMPFLTSVALRMQQAVYAPGDRPDASALYVVFKGSVKYNGKMLGPGDTFGEEDVLLHGEHHVRVQAMCKTYVHANYIPQDDLYELASHYPEAMRSMKKYVMWVMFRKYMIRLGREQIRIKKEAARVSRRAQQAAHKALEGEGLGLPGMTVVPNPNHEVSGGTRRPRQVSMSLQAKERRASLSMSPLHISPSWLLQREEQPSGEADGSGAPAAKSKEETEKEAAAALVKELTGLLSDAKVQSFVKKLTTLSGTSEGAPAPAGLLGGTFRPRVPTDIRTGLGWLDA
jgi:CRP-like cAMP-binding protein